MDDRPLDSTITAPQQRPMDRRIAWALGGLMAMGLALGLATTVLAADESASPSPAAAEPAATTAPGASDDAGGADRTAAPGTREDCPEGADRGAGGGTTDGTTPDPVTPDPTTAPSPTSDGV